MARMRGTSHLQDYHYNDGRIGHFCSFIRELKHLAAGVYDEPESQLHLAGRAEPNGLLRRRTGV